MASGSRTDGHDELGAATSEGEQVMDMLHEHVPLSLLMDLTAPAGPASAEILAEEGEPDQEWWQQG